MNVALANQHSTLRALRSAFAYAGDPEYQAVEKEVKVVWLRDG